MRRSPRYLELLEALARHGVDFIVEVGEGWTYDDLLPATVVQEVAELEVRSLTLSMLIELKELANRDKDRAMLPVLRRTLELREEE